jgi:hypothetical protein
VLLQDSGVPGPRRCTSAECAGRRAFPSQHKLITGTHTCAGDPTAAGVLRTSIVGPALNTTGHRDLLAGLAPCASLLNWYESMFYLVYPIPAYLVRAQF